MKRLILICLLVVSMAAIAPTAKAVGVNPAAWSFSLETETSGGNASWTSPTNVVTGYPQYEYNWQLTYADLKITGIGWYDIMSYIPGGDKSGSGTESGLPFAVLNLEDVGQTGTFTVASVLAGVDAAGYGYANMTDVVLGLYNDYGITGFRCGGNATVTAIPEPATIALLGLGSLTLLRRKRGV
jgi:hypothetical protein